MHNLNPIVVGYHRALPMESISLLGFKDVGTTSVDSNKDNQESYSKMRRRIDACNDGLWRLTMRCSSNHQTRVIGHCGIRWDKHCWETRFSRNLKKLSAYREGFGSHCTHLVLTWKRGKYDKNSKRRLEDSKRKFFQILRRMKYQFIATGTFDYGNPDHSDGAQTNIHLHVAMNMKFPIKKSILNDAWRRATNDYSCVTRVKRAKTDAVFRYISKRASGNLGHTEDVFLSDVMTLEQYHDLLYRSRAFFDSMPQTTCPVCKSHKKPYVRSHWNRDLTHEYIIARCRKCKADFVPKALASIVVRIYHNKNEKITNLCNHKNEDGTFCKLRLQIVAVMFDGCYMFMSQDYVPEASEPPDIDQVGVWNEWCE